MRGVQAAGSIRGDGEHVAVAMASARRSVANERSALARWISLGLATVFGALAPQSPALADEATRSTSVEDISALPLEQLLDLQIYSASRFAQKTSEAPSAARVITAAEIRAQGWRTLADALASLPGLFTSYDHTYTYLGARGFLRPGDYDSRFLLLVDGVRINDPVYDQAPVGTDFLVDMRLVERIEYAPGPGSSSFGSNAFFGVINVITRRGRDEPGAEATLETGSLGYRSAAAQYGWSDGGTRDVLLAASRARSDGATLYFPEFDTPETGNGVARGLDDLVVERALLKANIGDASIMLAHASQTKGDPTASFGQLFGDPRSRARDTRTIANFGYHAALADDLDASARVFAGRYEYFGTFVYAPPPGPLNYDTASALWFGASVQAVYTGWARHKLVVGFDAQRDTRRDLSNYDVDPYALYLDSRSTNTHLGPFIEDEFAIRDDLRLNAGLRYDYTSVGDSNTSPRLALIYAPTAGTTLKALFGRAYRAPNAYETSYIALSPGDPSGNANLDSERIRTSELVWSQHLGARTTLTTSVFRYNIRDLVSELVDPESGDIVFANRGRVTSDGFELALDHVWENGATARASYSFADVDDVATGQPFENAPRHLVKLGLTAPIAGTGLLAGVEGRYVSARLGATGSIDPYTVVDLTLTWPALREHLELSLSMRNVFGEHYSDPPGPSFVQNAIEQDGRTVLLEASYRF